MGLSIVIRGDLLSTTFGAKGFNTEYCTFLIVFPFFVLGLENNASTVNSQLVTEGERLKWKSCTIMDTIQKAHFTIKL